MLSHEQARRFYDRFGVKLDGQAFYEDPANADLVAHARFGESQAVFEFGCGTGRFAARLLADHLSADCRYVGIDISETMVRIARDRLRPWGERAEVRQSPGAVVLDEADAGFDRFIATYVLDLLSEEDISRLLAEAHRVLVPGGLLCLASLTEGQSLLAKSVTAVWKMVHAVRPALVGGCRPIRLARYLNDGDWRITHRAFITRGISSEVVVAARRP